MDGAQVAARLVQFLGAAALFGAPLFSLYSGGPGEARPKGNLLWPRRVLAAIVALVLVGALASLGLETAAMSGEPADAFRASAVSSVAKDTQFGHGITARFLLAFLMLPVLALEPRRARTGGLACLGAGVLASFALTGHGVADEGLNGVLHLAADVIHLLAAGAWIGALAALCTLLAGQTTQSQARLTYQALRRFSGIGAGIVALLIATGLVNGWFLVGPRQLGALITSAYGLVLSAKLALFVAMLALAAFNRFRLTPRLGVSLDDDPLIAMAALRRSVAFETALGVGVLTLVALLGVLAPLSMS